MPVREHTVPGTPKTRTRNRLRKAKITAFSRGKKRFHPALEKCMRAIDTNVFGQHPPIKHVQYIIEKGFCHWGRQKVAQRQPTLTNNPSVFEHYPIATTPTARFNIF